MIIEAIKWPLAKEKGSDATEHGSDDSEDEVAPAAVSAIAKFFKTFVEQGTCFHINLNIYSYKYWTHQEKSRKLL